MYEIILSAFWVSLNSAYSLLLGLVACMSVAGYWENGDSGTQGRYRVNPTILRNQSAVSRPVNPYTTCTYILFAGQPIYHHQSLQMDDDWLQKEQAAEAARRVE